MSQEGTDAVRGFRGQNVLELAGLLRNLMLILHMKGLHEKTLR